jgi:glycosyltransferase involved in cell wall biosynthesis
MPSNVDILLSVYNGEKYLPQLLESLHAQTHKHIKLIIRDDGSTDNSVKVINEFLSRSQMNSEVLNSSENLGAIGSFNELMNASTSDHIMFCDQDDVWLPQKVSKSHASMLSFEQDHPGLPLLLHTDLKVADEDLKPIAPSMWKYPRA